MSSPLGRGIVQLPVFFRYELYLFKHRGIFLLGVGTTKGHVNLARTIRFLYQQAIEFDIDWFI